jgi:hypothetical protein
MEEGGRGRVDRERERERWGELERERLLWNVFKTVQFRSTVTGETLSNQLHRNFRRFLFEMEQKIIYMVI